MSRKRIHRRYDGWAACSLAWRSQFRHSRQARTGVLNEMVTALDAMQEKATCVRLGQTRGQRLLRAQGGRPCAQHGPETQIDPDDQGRPSANIPGSPGPLAAEIMYVQRRRRGRFCLGES